MGNAKRSLRKHTARRKAARLALEQANKLLRKLAKPKKQPVSHDVYVRAQVEESPKTHDKRVTFKFRPALLAHPNQPMVVVDDVELVGFLEDPQEFGEFIATLGITTLASGLGVQLTAETKMGDVLDELRKFMQVDIEALKKAAKETDEHQQSDNRGPAGEDVQDGGPEAGRAPGELAGAALGNDPRAAEQVG